MTTELTDEQIREAAMKASRLEVERAPIASTELSDEKLIADARKYEFAEWGMNGALHRLADRLAERNATIERVQELLERRKKFRWAYTVELELALAPAQKEAAACEHLWGNAPMRSAHRCEKCGAPRGNESSEAAIEVITTPDGSIAGVRRNEGKGRYTWLRWVRYVGAAPDCRCDLEQWGRHHDKCQYSARILAYFPNTPDAQREAREDLELFRQAAIKRLAYNLREPLYAEQALDAIACYMDVRAAAKAGERR